MVDRLERLEKERKALDRAIAVSKSGVAGVTAENRGVICKQLMRYLLEAEDPEVKDYFLSALEEVLVSNDEVVIKLKIA